MSDRYALLIHGGAGSLAHIVNSDELSHYQSSINQVLSHGQSLLQQKCNALDTVVECVSLLENDPIFNAGYGSVLNERGKVEMDAAVMNGKDLSTGAVAGVHNIVNPVKLARSILENSRHILFIADGALKFAKQHNIELASEDYFITEKRRMQLLNAQRKNSVDLDHDEKYGTVGAVALDSSGNIAAATSTGGLTNKATGRVGDSPLIGAGVYADNTTCAISTTGIGEDIMRSLLAKTVADLMEFCHLPLIDAVEQAMQNFKEKFNGYGGLIALDKQGNYICRFTTPHMIYGWIDSQGKTGFKV